MPPGLAKKGKIPPGLAKKGKVPPGWSKWKKEKQDRWEKDLEEAREAVIEKVLEIKELREEDKGSAVISVEMAARMGVPVKHSRGIVMAAVAKRVGGEEIEKVTRAVAYGVGI